ncbi:MAG TPA: hypothetical protein VGI85_13055 [Chthoniobacterales bacterium]|jgi:uncharacterized membrane protein YphA (DoxX/SURF4 family)
MKIVTIIVRLLLGLIFVVFGFNGFFHFLKLPPPTNPTAVQFFTAMAISGYISVVFALQILGGLLLLVGLVPLGLAILCPVLVNITLFHCLMDPAHILHAIIPDLLALFLLWRYWTNFAGLLRPNA